MRLLPYTVRLKVLMFLFFLFSRTAATGYAAAVSGTVTDAKTGETLPGAAIQIGGTSRGTITDIDGAFRLEGLDAGSYVLVVSYVSYASQQIAVTLAAGEEKQIDIKLSDAALKLNDVVVMAQRRLDTDLSVLQTVKGSLPVANGISFQQISRTQDNDASQVLRRLPGITIADERFMVVRGLSQRYNGVWLNQAVTPAGETDSRVFSFDVLPASLLDHILVYKSASPELPAGFSGGFVKVTTKNVPGEDSYMLGYSTGFHSGVTFGNFHLTGGSFADGLGFGAFARQLPAGSPAHLDQVPVAEKASFTRQVNQGWGVRNFKAVPEQKVTFQLNRRFRMGEYQAGAVAALNYGIDYDRNEMTNNRYQSYDTDQCLSRYDGRYCDDRYRQTVRIGAVFNWSLLTDNSRYEFRNFFSQRGVSSLTRRQGHDYYSDQEVRDWESLYTGRSAYSAQLGGTHRLKKDRNKLDWTLGYAYARYHEPGRKMVRSLQTSGGWYVSDPQRYDQKLDDHGVSAAFNNEFRFRSFEKCDPVLYTGLYFEGKIRDFAARRFVYNLLGTGYSRYADWDYEALFDDANIASDRIYLIEKTNKSDSYDSKDLTGAAYVSMKLNYGEKLYGSVGVRAEYTRLGLNGYESDGIKPVSLDQTHFDLFPSINITCVPVEKHQIRLAYGRSVNRPELREIVPYVYWDFERFANVSGFAGLKNAYADQVDVRYEFYPSPGETVTVGFFYKGFTDPIEQTYHEAGSGVQYTFHNADRAVCYGIEADLKKSLDFMGLNGLELVFNGAWIYSRVFFPEGAFERDRPMQGQSPYLVNAGLFYRSDRYRFSASLLYNRIGKRIETVGIPKQNPNDDIPDVYEMPRNSLDVTLSRKIGKYVELKAGVKDLLNSPVEYKQFLTVTGETGTREVTQLVRSYRPGVRINIGVSVKF